ncbi:MAG: energy transducer TonB [Candidatus Saganbacteria bacterium]|nr:energy transducer TonB [Candidatus Saganbacteria bacterium]
MKNKSLILAITISLSIHFSVLFFTLSPKPYPLSPTKDGSTEMLISIGNIEPATKRRGSEEQRLIPSGSDGSSGQNQADSGKTRNDYLAEIRKRIAQFKKYPQTAKSRNWEGSPKVEFAILESGEIKGLKLTKGTKHQLLNEEALETIKRAAPFPPIPQTLGSSAIKVALVLVFRLK